MFFNKESMASLRVLSMVSNSRRHFSSSIPHLSFVSLRCFKLERTSSRADGYADLAVLKSLFRELCLDSSDWQKWLYFFRASS